MFVEIIRHQLDACTMFEMLGVIVSLEVAREAYRRKPGTSLSFVDALGAPL